MDLNLVAPINKTGYGYAAVNILKALQANQVNVSLFPLGQPEVEIQDEKSLLTALQSGYQYNPEADCLRIYHQHDLALHAGKGIHVGFPIFELDYLHPIIVHQMNSVDLLYVCSEWARKVCVDNGVTSLIRVVPLGVDPNMFVDRPAYDNNSKQKTTVFFNCGKWEYRKGHDIIIAAFEKAFKPSDNVLLMMNCYNPCSWMIPANYNKQWEDRYMNSPMAGRIRVERVRSHNQQDVARMMQYADCGVFPARAEGWNLELLEMMSMGKQVIATCNSGQSEYVNSKNTLIVESEHTEQAFDGVFFKDQEEKGSWAHLGENQVDQIVAHMKFIHETKQKMGFLCYNEEGVRTGKQYTWENTANKIVENLK